MQVNCVRMVRQQMEPNEEPLPEVQTWNVLIGGLPLAGGPFDLGSSLILRRLHTSLLFDLAAWGAVGFREWAVLEPLAASATAEITSPVAAAATPGYDALNKCSLISSLLIILGFPPSRGSRQCMG